MHLSSVTKARPSHLPHWNPRDARTQEQFDILNCTLRGLGMDCRACIIILFLVFAKVTDTDSGSHVLMGKMSFL